jgi:hypothetical protein
MARPFVLQTLVRLLTSSIEDDLKAEMLTMDAINPLSLLQEVDKLQWSVSQLFSRLVVDGQLGFVS